MLTHTLSDHDYGSSLATSDGVLTLFEQRVNSITSIEQAKRMIREERRHYDDSTASLKAKIRESSRQKTSQENRTLKTRIHDLEAQMHLSRSEHWRHQYTKLLLLANRARQPFLISEGRTAYETQPDRSTIADGFAPDPSIPFVQLVFNQDNNLAHNPFWMCCLADAFDNTQQCLALSEHFIQPPSRHPTGSWVLRRNCRGCSKPNSYNRIYLSDAMAQEMGGLSPGLRTPNPEQLFTNKDRVSTAFTRGPRAAPKAQSKEESNSRTTVGPLVNNISHGLSNMPPHSASAAHYLTAAANIDPALSASATHYFPAAAKIDPALSRKNHLPTPPMSSGFPPVGLPFGTSHTAISDSGSVSLYQGSLFSQGNSPTLGDEMNVSRSTAQHPPPAGLGLTFSTTGYPVSTTLSHLEPVVSAANAQGITPSSLTFPTGTHPSPTTLAVPQSLAPATYEQEFPSLPVSAMSKSKKKRTGLHVPDNTSRTLSLEAGNYRPWMGDQPTRPPLASQPLKKTQCIDLTLSDGENEEVHMSQSNQSAKRIRMTGNITSCEGGQDAMYARHSAANNETGTMNDDKASDKTDDDAMFEAELRAALDAAGV